MRTRLSIDPFSAEVFSCFGYHLRLNVKSDYPIDVWVVPSRGDADLIMEGGNFRYYSNMSTQRTTSFSASGSVSPGSMVVFANRNSFRVNLEVWSD